VRVIVQVGNGGSVEVRKVVKCTNDEVGVVSLKNKEGRIG